MYAGLGLPRQTLELRLHGEEALFEFLGFQHDGLSR